MFPIKKIKTPKSCYIVCDTSFVLSSASSSSRLADETRPLKHFDFKRKNDVFKWSRTFGVRKQNKTQLTKPIPLSPTVYDRKSYEKLVSTGQLCLINIKKNKKN